MKHLLLSLTLTAVAALTSNTASAQMAPPMDMSRLINSQLQMQRMGDQMARAAAQAYYNDCLRLRQQGFNGVCPGTPTADSMNATNQALVLQGMINSQAQRQNFQRSTDAITSTNNAITRGCSW